MSTNWTVVYVPAIDADDVRELVAKRQQDRGERTMPDPDYLRGRGAVDFAKERWRLDLQPSWTKDALAALAADSSPTAQRWAEVMDLAAATPERFISTEAVAEETSLTISDWRSACRTITRVLPRYDGVPEWATGSHAGKRVWPLADISGRDIGKKDQLYVAATREQAALWLEVR